MTLRGALPEDCAQIWHWSNDPLTRQQSFSPDPIPWKSHEQWYLSRLNDPATVFFIAEDQSGLSVAQCRFQIDRTNEATISISVAPEQRGKGIGTGAVREATAQVMERGISRVHAFVREDNASSKRLFEKAGYELVGLEAYESQPAWHFIFTVRR